MMCFNSQVTPTNKTDYSCHIKLQNLSNQSYGVYIMPLRILQSRGWTYTYACIRFCFRPSMFVQRIFHYCIILYGIPCSQIMCMTITVNPYDFSYSSLTTQFYHSMFGSLIVLVLSQHCPQQFDSERFLNQARTGRRAWFLKIDPVRIVCMRVCVSTPEGY